MTKTRMEKLGGKDPLTSLNGFIDKIFTLQENLNEEEVLLYRGHSNEEFSLIPSVRRNPGHIKNEDSMIRELISSRPSEFINDNSLLEKLIRAQHYGLPTRLLDLTWNPLVALYFSVLGNQDVNGRVFIFKIRNSSIKYYDNDIASYISNLSLLTHREKEEIINTRNKGESLQEHFYQAKLLEFVSSEKPHLKFNNSIKLDDLFSTIVVRAKMNNVRVSAQSGAFLLFGLSDNIQTNEDGIIEILYLRIDHNNKYRIKKFLESVSISDSTLFPEISRSAQYLSQKYESK